MHQSVTRQPPDYNRAKYQKSAMINKDLPEDSGIEVAFIGRSNAGKSSALNVITGIKGLARTSKTPGRTQMINFFSLDRGRSLVDLPGYGYAKVPAAMKQRWEKHVNHYLHSRQSLRGLVVVIDVRHPLKPMDQQVIDWALDCDLAVHVLLTKADKLSRSQALNTYNQVAAALTDAYGEGRCTVQLFSAHDRFGYEDAVQRMNEWFCDHIDSE